MEDKVDVLVSLSDDHLPEIDEVASKLEDAGLEVGRALPEIGTITGRVAASKFSGLGKVEGVAALERAGGFQIAPPDSDVQ
jgi:hypothetical protein